MDLDEETKRFKQILVTGLIFLVSTYLAYRELKYCIWGKTTDARIVRIFQSTQYSRHSRQDIPAVEYSFNDSGTTRTEQDTTPADWEPPGNGTVKIQYLPGQPYASRLQGHRNLVAVIFFFATLGAVIFLIYALVREARGDRDTRSAVVHHRR